MHPVLAALSGVAIALAPAAQAQNDLPQKGLTLKNLDAPSGPNRYYSSPYTMHYSSSPAHRPVRMFGGERQYASGDLTGAALFSNSFGQESATVYRGARLNNWATSESIYFQWVAGLMWGYKPPYDREVPLNYKGFSPMAVLALGWQITPTYGLQVNALGTAALMVQFSMATD
jgi:hypothetical protein